MSSFNRRKGFAMTLISELIRLLTGDLITLGYPFGSESHRHIRTGMIFYQPGIYSDLVPSHWHVGHGLCSSRNNGIGASAANPLCRQGDRLQPRRAVTINRHRRRLVREAGPEGDHASYIHSLLGFGHRTSENHVVDRLWIKRWHPCKYPSDRNRPQVVWTSCLQSPSRRFTHRSPDRAHNNCVPHSQFPLIAQGLPSFQCVANSLRSFWLTAKRQKCLPLKIQQIVFADRTS